MRVAALLLLCCRGVRSQTRTPSNTRTVSNTPTKSPSASATSTYISPFFMPSAVVTGSSQMPVSCELSYVATSGANAAAFEYDSCSRQCARLGVRIMSINQYAGYIYPAGTNPPGCACPTGYVEYTGRSGYYTGFAQYPVPSNSVGVGALYDSYYGRYYHFTTTSDSSSRRRLRSTLPITITPISRISRACMALQPRPFR